VVPVGKKVPQLAVSFQPRGCGPRVPAVPAVDVGFYNGQRPVFALRWKSGLGAGTGLRFPDTWISPGNLQRRRFPLQEVEREHGAPVAPADEGPS
jgi:hypothetical protein